jgi:hypothetical protein
MKTRKGGETMQIREGLRGHPASQDQAEAGGQRGQ